MRLHQRQAYILAVGRSSPKKTGKAKAGFLFNDCAGLQSWADVAIDLKPVDLMLRASSISGGARFGEGK
jgi:hypothetical protein